MNDGDFIRIDYVARISGSNEIFDLTREEDARKNGIYDPNFGYRSVPVILGAHNVVRGLEKELMTMKIDEKKLVTIKPEDALGERNPDLIKLIPLTEFKKRDIEPFPGMSISDGNMRGRVLAVSGGRVRVDFNHPLAGKTLEYDVEMKESITDTKEKVIAILELFLKFEKNEIEIKIDRENLEIKINGERDIPKPIKKLIADNITKWIKGIKKVKFIEEFTLETPNKNS